MNLDPIGYLEKSLDARFVIGDDWQYEIADSDVGFSHRRASKTGVFNLRYRKLNADGRVAEKYMTMRLVPNVLPYGYAWGSEYVLFTESLSNSGLALSVSLNVVNPATFVPYESWNEVVQCGHGDVAHWHSECPADGYWQPSKNLRGGLPVEFDWAMPLVAAKLNKVWQFYLRQQDRANGLLAPETTTERCGDRDMQLGYKRLCDQWSGAPF